MIINDMSMTYVGSQNDMFSFPVFQNAQILQGANYIAWMNRCFLAYI